MSKLTFLKKNKFNNICLNGFWINDIKWIWLWDFVSYVQNFNKLEMNKCVSINIKRSISYTKDNIVLVCLLSFENNWPILKNQGLCKPSFCRPTLLGMSVIIKNNRYHYEMSEQNACCFLFRYICLYQFKWWWED